MDHTTFLRKFGVEMPCPISQTPENSSETWDSLVQCSQDQFWNLLSFPFTTFMDWGAIPILYTPAGFRLYLKTSQNTSLLGSLRKGSRNMAAGTRYMSLLEPSDWKVLDPSKFHSGNSGGKRNGKIKLKMQTFSGKSTAPYLTFPCLKIYTFFPERQRCMTPAIHMQTLDNCT